MVNGIRRVALRKFLVRKNYEQTLENGESSLPETRNMVLNFEKSESHDQTSVIINNKNNITNFILAQQRHEEKHDLLAAKFDYFLIVLGILALGYLLWNLFKKIECRRRTNPAFQPPAVTETA